MAGSELPDDAVVIPIRFEPGDDRGRITAADTPSRWSVAETLQRLLPESETPVIGPEAFDKKTRGVVAAPRLARHVVQLDDDHAVGVAVSGKGVPLVVVHGFSAEGFLYAQTLSRIVSMGFKVIAIDLANHGSTQGLPAGGANFAEYGELLARTLDHLGIDKAFFAGHSMGGRVVTQMCGLAPERAYGVILIDAIVGDVWDGMVNVGRIFPPVMAGVVILLAVDSIQTVPLLKNPTQAAKFLRLFTPTLAGHVRRPWRLLGPGLSILRSRGSRWMLESLAQNKVPVAAIHGTNDFAVPIATAKAAATRAKGELVTVEGGGHSWILRDPETLPAILAELLQGRFGEAYRDAVRGGGLDPDVASLEQVEAALYAEHALILELTPPLEFARLTTRRREPAYDYTIRPVRER